MAAREATPAGPLAVKIRKLGRSDVPAVHAILQHSPEAAAWSRESLLEFVSVEPAAWVADLNGVLAGFLIGRLAADEFEILNMAVSHSCRRTGIGSKLLESALEFARISGSASAHLEVRASNGPAIALYARQGFTECGRRPRYYVEPVDDAILLSLSLGGTQNPHT